MATVVVVLPTGRSVVAMLVSVGHVEQEEA
jgi:hypothetical protein